MLHTLTGEATLLSSSLYACLVRPRVGPNGLFASTGVIIARCGNLRRNTCQAACDVAHRNGAASMASTASAKRRALTSLREAG